MNAERRDQDTVRRRNVRLRALLLCVTVSITASPVLAEPPDLEDTDYITGCLKDGQLLSFEVSSWGAFLPCWEHGENAEWITLPRANQNSQLFTVVTHGGGSLREGLVTSPPNDLILIKEIGPFRVYSLRGDCGIAVGPADSDEIRIQFPKGGFLAVNWLQEPYMIDATFDSVDVIGGRWRMGDPDEIFYNWSRPEMLIPRLIYGVDSAGPCSMAITFEYLETPYAHTVYTHDQEFDEVTVEYRREE